MKAHIQQGVSGWCEIPKLLSDLGHDGHIHGKERRGREKGELIVYNDGGAVVAVGWRTSALLTGAVRNRGWTYRGHGSPVQVKEQSEQRVSRQRGGRAAEETRQDSQSLGKSAADNRYGCRPSHWPQRLHSFIALEKVSNVSSHSHHSQWISGCYIRRSSRHLLKSEKEWWHFWLEPTALHVRQQLPLFLTIFSCSKRPADMDSRLAERHVLV